MPSEGLQRHIGFWLRLVSNSVSQAFAAKLALCDVTVAEWVVMREIYDDDAAIAPSAIARMTGMTRGAISKLTDRLVSKELCVRKDSEADRRFQELRLTRKGRALIPRLEQLAEQNEAEFFSGLSRNERQALKGLLIKTAGLNNLQNFPVE